jgi:hypothetical protein
VDVRDASATVGETVDLLVVGGPNHQLGMTRPTTRRRAALNYPEAPQAAATGLREWLTNLVVPAGLSAAVFDTRLSRHMILSRLDHAAGATQRILRRRGVRIIDPPAHFLVAAAIGPMVDGEIDRARAWGDHLGTVLGAPAHMTP